MSGGSNRLATLAALAADIRAAHQDVSSAAIKLAERALAAGAALIEAKRLVAHGEWQPWLRENCSLSERTARRYMTLVRSGFKTATVAVLGIRGAIGELSRVHEDDEDFPTVPTQTSTDRRAGSPGEAVSASDPESGEGDTVTRADDPHDHNLIERQQEAEKARPRESSASNRASAGLGSLSSTDDPPTASEEKTGAKGDIDAPKAPNEVSTDHYAGSQTAAAKASASLDPESGEIRTDPQDLFPDHNQDAIKKRRRRSKRTLLFPRTPEEQYAEWMRRITGSDDLPEVLERLKGLEPEEVIEALEKGPWLRAQR